MDYWTMDTIWAMDSRGAAGDVCGNSRLSLPANSELAHSVRPGGRRRGQHDSLPLAGTEGRVAGNAVGPRPAAAFRTGPQPRRRRLETGWRLGSVPRPPETVSLPH